MLAGAPVFVLCIACALQSGGVPAERPRRPSVELAAARARLEEVLADRRLAPAERRARLAAFLVAHGAELGSRERTILEVRLAVLDLARRAFAQALERFTALYERAPQADVDLRARTLLGRAEALAGLGRKVEARRTLAEVWTRHAGTGYARRARLLYARLEEGPPRPGRRLRRIAGLTTLGGEPFTPPAGRTWLLALAPPPPASLSAFLEASGFAPRDYERWPVPLVLVVVGAPDRERFERFAARHPAAARRILVVLARPDSAFLAGNGLDDRPIRVLVGPEDRILDVDPPAASLTQGRRR